MTSAKLEELYKELDQLDAGTHPKYLESMKQIEKVYEEQREREQIAHEVGLLLGLEKSNLPYYETDSTSGKFALISIHLAV